MPKVTEATESLSALEETELAELDVVNEGCTVLRTASPSEEARLLLGERMVAASEARLPMLCLEISLSSANWERIVRSPVR